MKNCYEQIPKMLGIFNILFFFIIMIVLVFSFIIVLNAYHEDSSLTYSPQATSIIFDMADKPLPSSTDTILNYNEFDSFSVPPDNQLKNYHPTEYLGYLSNPGIGWINRWGVKDSPSIPTTVAYSDRSEIGWNILNPQENVYNWEFLDAQLNETISFGKQFSFRVFTMIGESFGGHAIPAWVLEKGARILTSGEPDYSNCVYQEAWGKFVNELAMRYDGNPNIAFIDISGYGNFNEWSWRDDQTLWDEEWEAQYKDGIASRDTMSNIDSQARRRLVDMFIGGSYGKHFCRDEDLHTQIVNYTYPGFQQTQLVMPYAGIIQSSQYVYVMKKSVGFRYDCLGRPTSEEIILDFGKELDKIWMMSPVVFETCSEDQFILSSASKLINSTHGSLIHNVNLEKINQFEITSLTNNIGYRYYLSQIKHSKIAESGGSFYVSMDWQNLGNSPNYPKMGQQFSLHLYLLHDENGKKFDFLILDDLTGWYPSNDSQPKMGHKVEKIIELPRGMDSGNYRLLISIINSSTGNPIQLAIEEDTIEGFYLLSFLQIKGP